ncbi:pyridoxal-phosphate dependent enzyme [Thermodesulfobacteriota bacterium]
MDAVLSNTSELDHTRNPSAIEDLFVLHTPIETFQLNGRNIDVKRDDLYCREMIAPLAKMRGVHLVMNRLKEEGTETVGVFDFKVSKAGVGIAAMANMLEMRCVECYQHYKAYNGNDLPNQQRMCQAWGAELYPVPASRININYAMAKRYVLEQGGYMFPKGIILEETIDSVADEVSHQAESICNYENIVICVGSGTIITGLLKGLIANDLYPNIHAVCCTDSTIHCKRLYRFIHELSVKMKNRIQLNIHPAEIDYYSECLIACPFPSHPNYDRKAWRWLLKNMKKIEGDILFWNIGA